MNFFANVRFLSLCSCFVYFSLAACNYVEPISESELKEGMQALDNDTYRSLLTNAIPAASSGKNLFHVSSSPSEDCIRTARAIMKAFFKPSTYSEALYFIAPSINEILKHRVGSRLHTQVEGICLMINEEVKQRPVLTDFEKWKKNAKGLRPAKNYILEIPAGQNVSEWIRSVRWPFDDEEMFKFQVIMTMAKLRRTNSDEKQRDQFVTATAIHRLALRATNGKTTMDDVFEDAYEKFVKNLHFQPGDFIGEESVAIQTSEFLKQVDRDFRNNESLKEEYLEVREEIMKELLVPKLKSL